MIPSLHKYDNITALGILARAALSLEDKYNPASIDKFSDELLVREAILKHFRKKLGISQDDSSVSALGKLSDAIDDESDALIRETHTDEALERLSNKGELPSDLYEVTIIPNIQEFFGKKYDIERKFIEDTIKFPDSEQHYGPSLSPEDPCLISLFSKYFPNKIQRDSFTMLVAGVRDGLKLSAQQAWRIYPDRISVEGTTDLVDMLRRFADKFGAEIEFNGKKGNFFLTSDIPKADHQKFEFKVRNHSLQKSKKISINYCLQRQSLGSSNTAALVVGIDLDKYRKLLKSHSGGDKMFVNI